MSDEINYYGWDFLGRDIWPLGKPQEEAADLAVTRSSSRKSAMTALAVTLGITVGAFALHWWRRDRVETEQEIDAPASEPYGYAETEPVEYEPESPRPLHAKAVWLPRDGADFEKIVKGARVAVVWIRDPETQLRTLLDCYWRGLSLPTTPEPHDHPSVAQAVALARMALDTARAEYVAERQRAEAQPDPPPECASDPEELEEPDDDLEELDDPEELTCEVPRPGHFFRTRDGDQLLGDGGIATGALLVEAMITGCDRGWDRHTVETHAADLAANPQARATYAALIRQSEWNATRLEPLVEDTLLWLPPLKPLPLGDPNQQLHIAVDPLPWSDGSPRLEPPPQLRELNPQPPQASAPPPDQLSPLQRRPHTTSTGC
jgi:hypothetical protein